MNCLIHYLSISDLKVFVDKGVTLRTLKCELRPYVGVPLDYIKIYRTYSGKDTECSLTDSYRDEEKLIIKLERPLRKGECKGKVHLFTPHSPEVIIEIFFNLFFLFIKKYVSTWLLSIMYSVYFSLSSKFVWTQNIEL